MIKLMILTILLPGILVTAYFQLRYHLLQYLFFIRYPLWLGLAQLTLPFISLHTGAKLLLGNLFYLTPAQVFVVTWLAIITAWVLCTSAEMILTTTRERLDIRFRKGPPGDPFVWPRWIVKLKLLWYAIPAIPTLYGIIYATRATWWESALAMVPGIVAAVLLSILADRVRDTLRDWLERIASGASALLSRCLNIKPIRKLHDTRLGRDTATLYGQFKSSIKELIRDVQLRIPLGLIIVTSGLYLAGAFLLDPAYGLAIANHVPAMAYVLLIVVILGWVMPALAMYFDRLRLSPLLVMVVAVLVFYLISDSDHYYDITDVKQEQQQVAAEPLLPNDVVQAWRQRNPDATGMVVVAASGGGISASMWTSKVLTSLVDHEVFGERFGKSIVLVSSVSGGGIGSMYFVDGYDEDGPPGPEDRAAALAASHRSSLAATTWGMAYPDLWRTIAPWLIRRKARDRAWAQEQLWRQGLDDGNTSLHQWRQGVAAGWRPATIFNATVTETGERFLLTPVDIPKSWKAKTFLGQYPGKSIGVVTAARLSATFPYISPIAQARYQGKPMAPTLHMADGGYYDNFGIMSVVEWLEEVLPNASEELNLKRVLLVQIRAEKKPEEQTTERGWLYALAGPGVTLGMVRGASQIARNDLEVDLLSSRWADKGVTIQPAVFELGGAGPMSWQLSKAEKTGIHDAWACRDGSAVDAAICKKNEAAAQVVRDYFK